MKTDILNFKRLGLLFRRYFIERSHYELILWIIMAIIFMFIRNSAIAITAAILISGVIYASNFYKEIHSPGSGAAYFMIPATQLEKLIVGVVMTSFYYFAMILVTYAIGNLLGTLLNNLIANININMVMWVSLFHYSPLQWKLFEIPYEPVMSIFAQSSSSFCFRLFEVFLYLQATYLLGSIYFKRNHFFTTFLAKNVIGLVLLIVFIVELRLIFGGFSITLNDRLSFDFVRIVSNVFRTAIWLIPLFFWIVSYFRLTEKQV